MNILKMSRFFTFVLIFVVVVKGCPMGKYGENCDKICSKGCMFELCEKSNGACILGCMDGYQSSLPKMCDKKCSPGSYGLRCVEKCSKGCMSNMCDAMSGRCTEGCNTGFSQSSDGMCNIKVNKSIEGYGKHGHLQLKFVTEKSEWKQFFPAKMACEKDGGHLAYVKNFKELTHIYNALMDLLPPATKYSLTTSAWVGAEDLLKEGQFQWLDGSPVEKKLFFIGQPDNSHRCNKNKPKGRMDYKNHTDVSLNDGQDCVALYHRYYGLDDGCCTGTLPYVCQRDD